MTFFLKRPWVESSRIAEANLFGGLECDVPDDWQPPRLAGLLLFLQEEPVTDLGLSNRLQRLTVCTASAVAYSFLFGREVASLHS